MRPWADYENELLERFKDPNTPRSTAIPWHGLPGHALDALAEKFDEVNVEGTVYYDGKEGK